MSFIYPFIYGYIIISLYISQEFSIMGTLKICLVKGKKPQQGGEADEQRDRKRRSKIEREVVL